MSSILDHIHFLQDVSDKFSASNPKASKPRTTLTPAQDYKRWKQRLERKRARKANRK